MSGMPNLWVQPEMIFDWNREGLTVVTFTKSIITVSLMMLKNPGLV